MLSTILYSLACCLPISDTTDTYQVEKKIYADYHVTRLNRKYSGNVGVWGFQGTAKGSKLTNTKVNYNADLIDEQGRHQIASKDYPLVGMQSEMDPQYMEYQILSAKVAHIDGMMVEWGHKKHLGNYQLKALINVAKKYNFQIGVNWCIGWINQSSLKFNNRTEYLNYFKENIAYLRDSIYNDQTGVKIKERPVILLFAGNITNPEFEEAISEMQHSNSFPIFLRQIAVSATPNNNNIKMELSGSEWYDKSKGFINGIGGYFGWVPTRGRPTDTNFPYWDRHGLTADGKAYLDALYQTKSPTNILRLSSVAPGFDNRSCASWNSGDLSYISREKLDLYRSMWEHNIQNKEKFDWIYIPTWNDWTENSHIEPSESDNGAALQLTEKYAAQYKSLKSAPEILELPRQLFVLRKKLEKIKAIINSNTIASIDDRLDSCAYAISSLNSDQAMKHLLFASKKIDEMEKLIKSKKVVVSFVDNDKIKIVGNNAYITLDKNLADKLTNKYYEAYIDFEYKSSVPNSKILIKGKSAKPAIPYGNFGIIASINTDETMQNWQKGRVELFKENIKLDKLHTNNSNISIECSNNETAVQNIKITFYIYDAR